MPSILLVTNDFGPRAGGIETFVVGLLERIPRGHVTVYTSRQDGSEHYDHEWLDRYGVQVIRDSSRILLPTPRVISRLRAIIKAEEIETVWFGAAAPLGLSARWLRGAGVTRILALSHGHELWWSKLPPFSWAMREIGRHCDYITYLGEYTRRALARTIPEDRLVRIAPGIDTEHFYPRESEDLRLSYQFGSRPIIISVGRLVHRKGQDRLIQALPKIVAEIPDALLVLVGEGPYRQKLEELAHELHVEESVHFLGRIQYTDLPRYISMGDLFAMPSRDRLFGLEVEGLGIVYLEASSCGLPIIVGDSGGAPDALQNGETGFLVDGNDVADISEKILTLLHDSKLREEFGARGRQWAQQEWDWTHWSSKFNSLLGLPPSGK